jgi:hypothetical protein
MAGDQYAIFQDVEIFGLPIGEQRALHGGDSLGVLY